MAKTGCCYQCQDRHITTEGGRTLTCHSTCDKYKKFRKELDEFNAEKNRIAFIENGLDAQKCDAQMRNYKKKRLFR